MSTKSDVDVFVNGREIRKVGISVKYAGTKQAGQFAGVDAAKNLADGFASVGMDITRMSKLRNVRKATRRAAVQAHSAAEKLLLVHRGHVKMCYQPHRKTRKFEGLTTRHAL